MFLKSVRQRLVDAGKEGLSGLEIARSLPPEQVAELIAEYEEELWRERFRKYQNIFPDKTHILGDTIFHARELYPRHLEFFAAGAIFDERCLMAGNQVGKTTAGAFETSAHVTGAYPPWWEGRRFRHPVRCWAAGKTNETTRDIVQLALLGEVTYDGGRKTVDGSGLIPTEKIGRRYGQLEWKQGFQGLVYWVKVQHVTGGWSRLGFKSYQQGRGAFEGTTQHVIWTDEEPELDVYGEMLTRTMTTGGITYLTYTPLEGLTETVLNFLPDELRPATDEALSIDDWDAFLHSSNR